MIEPVGTGTRNDVPLSLPASSGSTRPMAFAAPVLLGMIDRFAARMRRRSGLPLRVALARSCSDWSLVYAWTVVMRPCSSPNESLSTFAIGARQLVVHDAFEITVCCRGVEHVVVDAHADGGVGVAARRRDDDATDAAAEVAGRLLAGGEEPGRLDHDVDVVVAPRDLGRVHDLELADLAPVDRDAVVGAADVVGERAAHRVVLQQEGDGVAVAHRVVHRHQLHAGVAAAARAAPG